MVGLHGGSQQVALEAMARNEIREMENPYKDEDGVSTLFYFPTVTGHQSLNKYYVYNMLYYIWYNIL